MKSPANKIDLLNEKAWELRRTDANQSMRLAKKSHKESVSLSYNKGIADSLCVISYHKTRKADYVDGMNLVKKARQIYSDLLDKEKEAISLNIIGIIYRNKSEYKQALKAHNASLELSKATTNLILKAETYDNIGSIYLILGELKKALKFYKQSLEILDSAKDDFTKANILKNIGTVYRHLGDNKIALEYMQKSLALFDSLGYSPDKAKVLNNIGIIYKVTDMYSDALESYNSSLKILQKLGDIRSEALVIGNIGIVYHQIGSYSDALKNHLKSLEITQKIGDKEVEAKALNNIAIVYQETGDYKNALENYERSINICKKINDKYFEGAVLKNISEVYDKQGKHKIALKSLQKSLSIIDKTGNKDHLARIHNDIADVYRSMGNFKNSYNHYNKCLTIAKKNDYKQCQIGSLLGIGTLLVLQKKYNEATKILKQTLQISKKIGSKNFIYNVHEMLSKCFEGAGDFKKSLKHLQQFLKIREELLNEETDRTRKKITAIYEVEAARRDAEIYKLKTVELGKKSEELHVLVLEKNKLLEERKALMEIAAHDLRNPIFDIMLKSSLGSSPNITSSKKAILFKQISSVAERTVEILEKLLSIETIEAGEIRMDPKKIDLGLLASEVTDDYQHHAKKKSITIHYKKPKKKTFVFADDIAIREAMDNIVSNAVKYTPLGKNIFISINSSEKKVRFKVKDEGPGLSPEDKEKLFEKFCKLSPKPTGDEYSVGLGLSIVKSLVENMNGRIWCESKLGQGSSFIFELPLSKSS